MRISLNNHILTIELEQDQSIIMSAIHERWPHLLEEYINMIIRNRERQLTRIEVTERINKEKKDKK